LVPPPTVVPLVRNKDEAVAVIIPSRADDGTGVVVPDADGEIALGVVACDIDGDRE
jgi:type IV secretory pathway TraG/TraD family ATPase VirD4